MSSSENSSDNSQQQPNCKKSSYRKSFSQEFEQLLNVEICPTLWVAVHKSRSSQGSMFVDIRRKKEGQWRGSKIYIPTTQGLFLKYPEYEKLKQKFEDWLSGLLLAETMEKVFEFSELTGRTVFAQQVIGAKGLTVGLKTETKQSCLVLHRSEITKIISNSVADAIGAAMCQSLYD
uniref:Uncharacterized protein n=1 Tax=Tetranychus urticae TaxID=32264 RepID=T1K792_TETUR